MKIKEFKDIKEFAADRKLNRLIFSTMCYAERKELKEYVYSLNERNNRKDLIWEYLNEPMDTEYFVYISIVIKSYLGGKK